VLPEQAGCSGADETRDGRGGLLELRRTLLAAGAGGVEHAVLEVIVEETRRDSVQGPLQGADMGEDVDAVLLLVHRAVQTARLALDALEPCEVAGLVGDVAVVVLLVRGGRGAVGG